MSILKQHETEWENIGKNVIPNLSQPHERYSKLAVRTDSKPSKLELAIQHFRNHPEDRSIPGRDLEEQVKPGGVKISYKYWNTAKKQV